MSALRRQTEFMGTDDVRTIVLVVHVAAGIIALLLAAVVMAAGRRQDWSTRLGTGYVGCVVTVAVSAIVLAAVGATLPAVLRWVLVVLAIATAAAAVRGVHLARRSHAGPGSLRPTQLRLLWGSVTSLVSAVAIVSAPVVVWTPVVIGATLLTEWGYRQAQRDPAWA